MKRFIGLFLCFCFVGPAPAQEIDQQYMAVFIQGKRVGYYKKLRKAFADSVVTTELMVFSVDAGEGTIDKLTVDETVETVDGQLIHFRHETAKGKRFFRLIGIRDGSKLRAELVSDKDSQQSLIDWPEGALMAEGRRLLAKEKGLQEGTQYRYVQFFNDGLTQGEVDVSVVGKTDVAILDETMSLTETRETILLQNQQLEYTVYRDASTMPMKIVAPSLFMEMVNCSEAYAMTPPE